MHLHLCAVRRREERCRAAPSLFFARAVRGEYDPGDTAAGVLLQQAQQRAAAADLDVIAVRAEGEDAQRSVHTRAEIEP
jgi:hypothetical protein